MEAQKGGSKLCKKKVRDCDCPSQPLTRTAPTTDQRRELSMPSARHGIQPSELQRVLPLWAPRDRNCTAANYVDSLNTNARHMKPSLSAMPVYFVTAAHL